MIESKPGKDICQEIVNYFYIVDFYPFFLFCGIIKTEDFFAVPYKHCKTYIDGCNHANERKYNQ